MVGSYIGYIVVYLLKLHVVLITRILELCKRVVTAIFQRFFKCHDSTLQTSWQ